MDVERTIEFLLEQSAKHDTRMGQIEELLLRGAKMLVSNQEANRLTDNRISALVDAQMKTEQTMAEMAKSVQAILDSMRGGNGKEAHGE